MTPERIPVGWCHSCPFAKRRRGDNLYYCRRALRPLQSVDNPPDWCPLRTRPVLFELSEQARRDGAPATPAQTWHEIGRVDGPVYVLAAHAWAGTDTAEFVTVRLVRDNDDVLDQRELNLMHTGPITDPLEALRGWLFRAPEDIYCARIPDGHSVRLVADRPDMSGAIKHRPVDGGEPRISQWVRNDMTKSEAVIRIDASVPWTITRAPSGRYVGVCERLQLTVQSDTWAELLEDIAGAIDSLFKDLLSTHELEQFLSDRGWAVMGSLPATPDAVRFDVPFVPIPAMGDLTPGSAGP